MISFSINQRAGKKISANLWKQLFATIERVLGLRKSKEVSVAVIGEKSMRRLNSTYRHQDRVTDVLSFGQDSKRQPDSLFDPNDLGEIIICYPQAVLQAKRAKHSFNAEIELLLVHGFLHLLGYNHTKERQAVVMERLEKKILANISRR